MAKSQTLSLGAEWGLATRDYSLQTVCAKIMPSRMIAAERHSVQNLYLFAITLLQVLTYFALVAELLPFFVMLHTIFIENFLFYP